MSFIIAPKPVGHDVGRLRAVRRFRPAIPSGRRCVRSPSAILRKAATVERSGLVIERVTTRKNSQPAEDQEPGHHGAADAERAGGLGIGLVERFDDLEGPVDFAFVPVFHLRAGRILALGIAPQLLRLRRRTVAEQAVLREADGAKVADGVALVVDFVVFIEVARRQGLQGPGFQGIGFVLGIARLELRARGTRSRPPWPWPGPIARP